MSTMPLRRVRVTVETACDCATPCGNKHFAPVGGPKAYVVVAGIHIRVPVWFWYRLADRRV